MVGLRVRAVLTVEHRPLLWRVAALLWKQQHWRISPERLWHLELPKSPAYEDCAEIGVVVFEPVGLHCRRFAF